MRATWSSTSYWIHKGFCPHQVLQLPRGTRGGQGVSPCGCEKRWSVYLCRQRTSKYPTWGGGIGSAHCVANANASRAAPRSWLPHWGARDLAARSHGLSGGAARGAGSTGPSPAPPGGALWDLQELFVFVPLLTLGFVVLFLFHSLATENVPPSRGIIGP